MQAKCFAENTPITKKHMDSFLSESGRFPNKIKKLLLLSATDKIEGNAKTVLEIRETKVVKWLLENFENSPIIYPKHISELYKTKSIKAPENRQYQNDAVNTIQKKFRIHDRGQLIMACGTGKTFVTLWVKERMEAKSTLVLLPSLNLLSQTLMEWTANCSQKFDVLCVCSDKSIATKNSEDMRVAEAPFDVTSDINEISKFLSTKVPKVIFCTYHSSKLISAAQGSKYFDLIISDEAHRCAGSQGDSFTRVLDEKLIKGDKRLFTTATPKVFSKRLSKAKEERGEIFYGMDNLQAFGPVFFEYTFGQAIKDKWLSDYQVIIYGVNEPMIKALINDREFFALGYDKIINADILASIIGLTKSIDRYNFKRIISFHNKVFSAKSFASDLMKIIDIIDFENKPNGSIYADYVSGKMRTSIRTEKIQRLKDLKQHDIGLLTNARCLSEGVNVPTLDAVAFIDPKSSQIDIIQAVGRAIRLSSKKEKGSIILPIFIEDAEDPVATLETSNFKYIWDILKALRSHDETLAEELDEYRTSMGRKHGSKKKVGLNKIIYDLPQDIDNNFAKAIETKLVETTTSSWDFWYGLLMDYCFENSDCLVKDNYEKDGFKLGNWVEKQRTRKNQLNKVQLEKLNKIGFVWNVSEYSLATGYEQLKIYKDKYGDCLVPSKYKIKGYNFGLWVSNIRHGNIKISKDFMNQINEIGFVWDTRKYIFNNTIKHLKEYKTKFGDYNVPRGYKVGKYDLSYQVLNLRARYRSDKLENGEIYELEQIDFIFDTQEYQFNIGYNHLKRYIDVFGNCLVKPGYEIEGFKLGMWLARIGHREATLTKEQIKKLKKLGIVFGDKLEIQWNEGFKYLKEYKIKFGNCNVPKEYKLGKYRLGLWVGTQRKNQKAGKLSEDRKNKLNKIGFIWDTKEYRFLIGYSHLVKYKKEFGDCKVPSGYRVNQFLLGSWRYNIRYGSISITDNQRDKLNELGFFD